MSVFAGIAQLVERDLAKVEVAGSTPVFRSFDPSLLRQAQHRLREGFLVRCPPSQCASVDDAWVVELVDTQDLKACGFTAVRVQVPSRVLNVAITL